MSLTNPASSPSVRIGVPKELLNYCYCGLDRDLEDIVLKQETFPSREQICGEKDFPYRGFSELLGKIEGLTATQRTDAQNRFNRMRREESECFRTEVRTRILDLTSGRQITPLSRDSAGSFSRYIAAFKELEKYLSKTVLRYHNEIKEGQTKIIVVLPL